MPLRARQFKRRPAPEALGSHLAGRHQQVGVMMALVAVAARLVHGEVDRAPIPLRQLPRESTGEFRALSRRKLPGKYHQHLARKPRIAAIRVLRRVPQRRSIARPVGVRPAGELRGQHDLLVKDVVTIGVVVDLACALVADALARAVGRSPRDAAAFSPREDLDVQKVLCHRAVRRRAAPRRHGCPNRAKAQIVKPHALQQTITRGPASRFT